MVTRPKGVPYIETIKLVDKMWHREGKKDAMLLVKMKKMELLTNDMKGFHAKYNQANHDYEYAYYGNQGWNNVRSVDRSSQERNESLPPHTEITIKVVLEKEWMNELASQVAAQTTETNKAPMQAIVDNDIFEWEMEEEVVGELIANVFLKGEEVEEIVTCDWGPFTIPVDPYFPELVWEFYASYRERKQLLKHTGRTKAFPFLTSTNSVITLATKIDKEAPFMKRAKYTENKTPPPPSASSHILASPLHTNEFHSAPPYFLNIAQRAKMHES
ncbi:hypothetical protein HAX54_019564 [Datura stramonium]|uniref:Uncharacterized protein n=1 Tax=Datura stramonium TaxID=4076 RepID=A0ABS8UPG3_DATST|nr:hypothetical protein [Datura stramonium]